MRKWLITLAAVLVVAAGCGGEQTRTGASPSPTGPPVIQVRATDYAFEGVPETIAAGEVTFVLTNDGEVAHEMAIGTLPGDTTVEEAIGSGDAGSERVGIITAIEPGATADVTLELEPGRYAYVCFVGEGTGDEPHALHGMVGEFTVVGD